MTFATMSIGLIPILWSTGAGSEIMKHIAAPMVGGIVTSFLLELLVYPAVYAVWRERTLPEPSPTAMWEQLVSADDSQLVAASGSARSAAQG
jgi:hypothetical protein